MYAMIAEYTGIRLHLGPKMRKTLLITGGVIGGLLALAKCEGGGPHP